MHDKLKVLLTRLVGADAIADGYFDKEDVTADSLVQQIENKVGELVKPTIENTLKSKFDADFATKLADAQTAAKNDSLKVLATELQNAFPNISKADIKEVKDLVKAIGKTENDNDRTKLIAELQLMRDTLETENRNFKHNFIPKSELETFKSELSRNQYVNSYYNSLGKVTKEGIPADVITNAIKAAVSSVKTSFDSTDGKWYVVNENNERVIATGQGRFKELSDVINATIDNDVKWAFQDKPIEKKVETGGKAPAGGTTDPKTDAYNFVMNSTLRK